MKKIMILGAGTYQVPLIQTARRMGLYTIVVSIPGDYQGFALANKIYELDTRDKDGILEAAREEQIDGICTSGTDVAVSTIGYVCEKMGLSGIPQEAAAILTDKALMKEAFLKGGVSASTGMRVYSLTEARSAAERIGYPVVVKRVDSSGSRGITVVEQPERLEEAYHHAAKRSTRDSLREPRSVWTDSSRTDSLCSWHHILSSYTEERTPPYRWGMPSRIPAAGKSMTRSADRCRQQ